MTDRRFAVVGGGVSGLAAAHFLRQRGIDAEVIELGAQLGGRVNPTALGARMVDLGGKNIGRRYALFREFAASLGKETYEYFGTSTSRIENGSLVRFDGEKRFRAIVKWAQKASPLDIGRFARMFLHVKRKPDDGFMGTRYFERFGDTLVSEHFGAELCRSLVRFLTVRMNGAEPDEYFMRNFGSNLGLAVDSIEQLQDGMKPLMDSFAAKFPLRLNTRVTGVIVERGRVDALETVQNGARAERRRYDGVVLATPALASAELIEPHSLRLADQLRTVRYFPVAIVVAEYAVDVFRPDLRAVVFDESSPLSNAGAYGINDLRTVRFTFSGRGARRLLAQQPNAEELVARAERELNPYLPADARDRVGFTARQYRHGLCAHSPNRARLSRVMNDELGRIQGLHVTGDYLRGASIEACFRAARDAVAAIPGV